VASLTSQASLDGRLGTTWFGGAGPAA
jgi:hypothetical protein